MCDLAMPGTDHLARPDPELPGGVLVRHAGKRADKIEGDIHWQRARLRARLIADDPIRRQAIAVLLKKEEASFAKLDRTVNRGRVPPSQPSRASGTD